MDKKVEFPIQNDMHRKGLCMNKFSNCPTERRSLTISFITEAFPSFASRVEETVRPLPHQRNPFSYQSFRKQPSYFFSLRYLLATVLNTNVCELKQSEW